MVLMGGEFGRTPRIGDVTPDGRSHWPEAGFLWVAGGGLKTGQIIGATDAPRRTSRRQSDPDAERAGDALSACWASTPPSPSPTTTAGPNICSRTASPWPSCCKWTSATDCV